MNWRCKSCPWKTNIKNNRVERRKEWILREDTQVFDGRDQTCIEFGPTVPCVCPEEKGEEEPEKNEV